jgi:hypothetical protein
VKLEQLNTEFVNVAKLSENELGRRLTMNFHHPFSSIFGKFNNIRSAVEYIFIKNYPKKLLNKKLTKIDIASIPKLNKTIPNYWAMIAHLFISRMEDDVVTSELLRVNTLPIVSYNVRTITDPYLGDVVSIKENHKLKMYLVIINNYSRILKGKICALRYKEDCEAFINSLKECPEDFIYEGNVHNIRLKT